MNWLTRLINLLYSRIEKNNNFDLPQVINQINECEIDSMIIPYFFEHHGTIQSEV